MNTDLFTDAAAGGAPAHDPGGKSTFRLPKGVHGTASFSPCNKFRTTLTRWWSDMEVEAPPALFVGMNPSTAGAFVNDPTVLRECNFTRDRLGLAHYVKCNVMDYRATNPDDLLALEPEQRCSADNLSVIADRAKDAAFVIVAWGALPKKLRPHADAVMSVFRDLGVTVHCLGYTKDGSPRHPLYLPKDAPLLPFPAVAP